MNLLDKPRKIKRPLSLPFTTLQAGWYIVSVSARVKSERQRGVNVTDDEDLVVKIDGKTFPHLKRKGRLKDSPAAFSGGRLHNKLKTVYFITHLTPGDHQVVLNPQHGAEVEEVSYKKIAIEDSKINLSIEKQAEKANGRPWITFVLDGLALAAITAKVTVKWHFPDGDDAKLIVDSKIKRNPRSILHKNWIWASNILHKIFGGETQENTFAENLPRGLHYIEFHADESPTLHSVSFNLKEVPLPRAKIVVDSANLRQEPSQGSSSLLTFNTGDVVEVSQKAVEGEAPYKERGDFTNIWHKVRFREVEGYIFSKALEIEDEDPESISREIIRIAKELTFDPTLALAIARRESGFFPYAVSSKGAQGVFQITTAALRDIKEEFRPTNIFDVHQNIESGVRYLLKLRDCYYKNDPEQELKVIAAYNAGPTAIKTGIPLGEQGLPPETRKYIEDVLRFKEEFKKEKKLLLLPGLLFLLVIVSVLLMGKYNSPDDPADPSRVLGDTIERNEQDEFANTKKSLRVDLDGDGVAEEIVFVESGPTPVSSWVVLYLRQGDTFTFVDKVGGYFDKAQAVDLDEDGNKELVMEVVTGHLVITVVYRYHNGALEYVPELGSEFHGLSSESGVIIANINHDKAKELILYSFWPPDEKCESIAKVYQYHEGQLIKYLDATVAKEFCDLDPTFWGI